MDKVNYQPYLRFFFCSCGLIFYFQVSKNMKKKLEVPKEVSNLTRTPRISCVTIFKSLIKMEMRYDLCPVSLKLSNFVFMKSHCLGEFFSFEQEMLLFAVIIWRGDRKQILIMLWTHRGKKKSLTGHSKISQYCKTAKHGGSLCPFPVPRNAARLMTWGGVGEVNDITSCAHIWILTQWHLVFLFTPALPAISSLKPGLCSALPFLSSPQRIPPFLFRLLSSCLCKKWRKWHSISWWMALDP